MSRKGKPILRLWFLLRVAFHDWMWETGPCADTPGRLRPLARRLPLYFSDPHMPTSREMRDLALTVTTGPVTVQPWAATTSTMTGNATWTITNNTWS